MIHSVSYVAIPRHSYMEIGKLYFWTATIKDWNKLLESDEYKNIIVEVLTDLSQKELIKIYAFVIMPHHVHFIWKMLRLNGKEKPVGSFLKHTAHLFRINLHSKPEIILPFKVDQKRRMHQFWKDDPLAIELYSSNVIHQKLNYIHNNPIKEKWSLCQMPEDYKFSSASFYLKGEQMFDFIHDLREEYILY